MLGRYPAAAAIIGLLVVGVSVFFWIKGRDTQGDSLLKPGGLAAILTLSDGRQFKLDSSVRGRISVVGSVDAENAIPGEIRYVEAVTGQADARINTLTTPRGGQFKLILSDGTSLWLNDATTVRFANSFGTGPRSVELVSGEAYVETAHASGQTFSVNIPGPLPGQTSMIQALGTNFDINSYPDEPELTATLLSGLVRVIHAGDTALVRPQHRAKIGRDGSGITVDSVADATKTIVWKDGYFQFDGVSTEELMRQLARWYDAEVVYDGPVAKREFFGRFSRNMPLSHILRLLEANHVRWRIDGRKIIITPDP